VDSFSHVDPIETLRKEAGQEKRGKGPDRQGPARAVSITSFPVSAFIWTAKKSTSVIDYACFIMCSQILVSSLPAANFFFSTSTIFLTVI